MNIVLLLLLWGPSRRASSWGIATGVWRGHRLRLKVMWLNLLQGLLLLLLLHVQLLLQLKQLHLLHMLLLLLLQRHRWRPSCVCELRC